MKRLMTVIAIASVLSGCAEMIEAQQRARENRLSNYASTCAKYGFQPGTQDHSRCVMQLDQQAISASRQADAARQAEYERRQSELQNAMILRPPQQTTCSSTPNGAGGFNTICR